MSAERPPIPAVTPAPGPRPVPEGRLLQLATQGTLGAAMAAVAANGALELANWFGWIADPAAASGGRVLFAVLTALGAASAIGLLLRGIVASYEAARDRRPVIDISRMPSRAALRLLLAIAFVFLGLQAIDPGAD